MGFDLSEGMTGKIFVCRFGFECLLQLEIKMLLLSCSTFYKLHFLERSRGFIMHTDILEGGEGRCLHYMSTESEKLLFFILNVSFSRKLTSSISSHLQALLSVVIALLLWWD